MTELSLTAGIRTEPLNFYIGLFSGNSKFLIPDVVSGILVPMSMT